MRIIETTIKVRVMIMTQLHMNERDRKKVTSGRSAGKERKGVGVGGVGQEGGATRPPWLATPARSPRPTLMGLTTPKWLMLSALTRFGPDDRDGLTRLRLSREIEGSGEGGLRRGEGEMGEGEGDGELGERREGGGRRRARTCWLTDLYCWPDTL